MNTESDARNPDDGHRPLVWLDELCDRFEAAWNTSARTVNSEAGERGMSIP